MKSLNNSKYFPVLGNIFLALCALILLAELWGISFTTGDDKYLAVARFKEGGVFTVAMNAAIGQSRFFDLLTYPLVQIPYLFKPFFAISVFRIISNALPFLAFYFMARQLFGSRVAKIASFIGLGIFETTGSFNPFHSLPLWFNTNAFLLMLSIAFYHRRLLQGKSLILPSVLYFSSLLFYESFLLYFPVFFGIYWHVYCKNIKEFDVTSSVVSAIKINRALLTAVIAYLLIYVAFRAYFFNTAQGGGGYSLSLAPLTEIISTIYKFSLGSISLKIRLPAIGEILSMAGIFSLLLVLGLSMVFLSSRNKTSAAVANAPLVWIVLIYSVVAPNILYGLTARYRDWAIGDSCYIGSYYSVFAIALIVGLFITREIPSAKTIRDNWGIYVLSMAALFCAATLNFSNTRAYFDKKREDALRWPAMLAAIPALNQSNLTRLCSETFLTHPSDAHYWTYYLQGTLGREMQVRLLPNYPQHCDGFIEYKVENDKRLIKISSDKDVIYSTF